MVHDPADIVEVCGRIWAPLQMARVKRHLTRAGTKATFVQVIRTFRSRALQRYFEVGDARGLSVPNVSRIGRMLRVLDAATRPEHVNLPGYYFHSLRGAGRWSIRVSGNWRITFGWVGADAVDVDLEDYH